MRFLSGPATATMDMPLKLAAYLDDASHNGGAGAQINIDGPAIADIYWLMHDPISARRYMALSDPENPITKAEALLLAGYADLDRGDGAAAVAPLEAFWAAWQADPSLQNVYPDTPCYLGLAYGLAGRMAEARAVFARFGAWSRCAAMDGDVLEHAGDLAGAQRVWARGIAIAPDLGWIYLHRGVSALNRGDLAAAAADLAAANARAPHWADPLKAWGDLLAREGRWKAALAKYDAALPYAPAWRELRQAPEAVAGRAR
jgi:tetratricopeptide (TPR) repeat protein